MVNRAVVRDAFIVIVCILSLFCVGLYGALNLSKTVERFELSESLGLSELLTLADRFDMSDLLDIRNLFDSPPAVNAPTVSPATTQTSKANVTNVRFFEETNKIPPPKDRKYATEFAVATSRFIFIEVSFKHHRYKKSESEIPLIIEYYNPEGKRIAELKRMVKIKKQWATASYATGWGKTTPGGWETGKYSVKLYLEGQPVGEYNFTVY